MGKRPLAALLAHRSARVGLAILAVFVLLAATIGILSSHDPNEWRAQEAMRPPSREYLFGTDASGRDIFTRVFFGARLSLAIGVTCVAGSAAVGIPLGALAGYFGRWVDSAISRLVDVLLSFPSILLAIAIAASMGPGIDTVVISVGVVGIPQFARQTRASVLSIKELDYVQASRALGFGHARILFVHILPNALGPLIVLGTLSIGGAILSAAGLSFLGLGVESGTPEWGAMLHEGYSFWRRSSSLAVFSGLAISLAVLGFNLLGDGLRDALDPKLR